MTPEERGDQRLIRKSEEIGREIGMVIGNSIAEAICAAEREAWNGAIEEAAKICDSSAMAAVWAVAIAIRARKKP